LGGRKFSRAVNVNGKLIGAPEGSSGTGFGVAHTLEGCDIDYENRLYSLRKNCGFWVAQRFNPAIEAFPSVWALAPEVPKASFSASFLAAEVLM